MESKVTANHLRVKAPAGSSPALSAKFIYFDWTTEWIRMPEPDSYTIYGVVDPAKDTK